MDDLDDATRTKYRNDSGVDSFLVYPEKASPNKAFYSPRIELQNRSILLHSNPKHQNVAKDHTYPPRDCLDRRQSGCNPGLANDSTHSQTPLGSRLPRKLRKPLDIPARDDSVDSMRNNVELPGASTPHTNDNSSMQLSRLTLDPHDTKSSLKRTVDACTTQSNSGEPASKCFCREQQSYTLACKPSASQCTLAAQVQARGHMVNGNLPSPVTSPGRSHHKGVASKQQQKCSSNIKELGRSMTRHKPDCHPLAKARSTSPKPQPSELQEEEEPDEEFPVNKLIRQPEPCIMSPQQLMSEVLGIYAAIETVERKCIAIDQGQMGHAAKRITLSDHNWQALTAVHRTLLYEHYDFLIASQQPTAPEEVKRMATEKQMPLRLWRFAIHSYLEVLRLHLPESMDFMVNYIMVAYQMLALLFETVPTFEVVWTECLGDLARYRMAIENKDIRDREVWTGVAHYWYLKASEKQPDVGRLYHHLGILARPRALQQLYYYTKSLTCIQPFHNAKESIKTIFDPALGWTQQQPSYATELDEMVVKVHAVMFNKTSLESADAARNTLLSRLGPQITHAESKWREYGVFIAVINISAWFSYGLEQDPLRQLLLCKSNDGNLAKIVQAVSSPPVWLAAAISLTFDVFRISLNRIQDPYVLPHVHLMLIFLLTLCRTCLRLDCMSVYSSLTVAAPWKELAKFLDKQTALDGLNSRTLQAGMTQQFLQPERGDVQPLPEDHLVRGLTWCKDYFPLQWFSRDEDEESRMLERPSTHSVRSERVLWTAICVAQACIRNDWLN
ncbi:hypothetical protein MBLNU457_4139t1 [Dothideomycetes sp. NU457]